MRLLKILRTKANHTNRHPHVATPARHAAPDTISSTGVAENATAWLPSIQDGGKNILRPITNECLIS